MTEDDVKRLIAEYENQRNENTVWNKTKQFVVKNIQTVIIAGLLFYAFGGFSGTVKLFESIVGKMFDVQVNNALIQRIIPDGKERTRFIERIQKLFARDYTDEEQFASDYRQTTADFRYKYPALREQPVRSKEQLAAFIGGQKTPPVPNSREPPYEERLLTKLNELEQKLEQLTKDRDSPPAPFPPYN